MRACQFVLLMTVFMLAGCDRITGAANQKILDAEAIGYACRVSFKTPEECMKENEAQSPTSILDGWKLANKDIDGQIIDPHMGKQAAKNIEAASQPVAAETAGQAESVKPAEPPKGAKPAAAPAKPKAAGH
ncbi:MAG: hypothetical protein K2P67_06420 [Gallionellaceae bacterium]|jgi:hypothetical protein|nr:hypothetical protein [Gallionellaceae bacterium]